MSQLTLKICNRCKVGPYRFVTSLRRVSKGNCENCDSKMTNKSPGHVVYWRGDEVLG